MKTFNTVIQNNVGLHARPAAKLIKALQPSKSNVQIKNCTKSSELVNAKSFVKVLSIGVDHGHEVQFVIEGEDEEQTEVNLKDLISNNFGDPLEE